jgi:hypothetical protein
MSDAQVIAPDPTPAEPDAAEAMGQTSLEHDGRVFTGTDTDADATAEAFAETTAGRKAEVEERKADPNKPIRGRRRFDQLTFEREEAKREAAALKAELDSLKAKPASAEPAMSAKTETPAEPKQATPATKEPELEDFLDQPDPLKAFNTALKAYLKAEVNQTIDARLSQRLEAERASRQLTQTVADLRERGKSAYKDFETVLAGSDVQFPEPILWNIVNDPNGEHIQYALATDPDLAKKVAAIRDPLELGRVLGRLGATGTSAPPASPAPVVKSTAPRPFQPVSGASRTTSPSIEDLADAGDYDRYKASRHAQMGIKAR